MRFAALGRTAMLARSVRACAAAGHACVLIATAPAAPESAVTEEDFAALAAELGCPLARAPDAAALQAARAEAAISVNWPVLIGRDVRDALPHGVLNGHAGDLPRYRGNAAPNWAILAGEDRVVATVHRMDDGLDTGPILAQRAFALDASTYVGDVYAFLEAALPALFAEVLGALADGSAVARPQAREGVLRCHPRRPEDSEIDWACDAAAIARLVRASAEPFAGAYTWLDGERLTIWRARAAVLEEAVLGVPGQVIAVRPDAGEADVLTGGGRLVAEVVEAGAGRVPAAALLRSGRRRLGRPPWPRPTGTFGTSGRTT